MSSRKSNCNKLTCKVLFLVLATAGANLLGTAGAPGDVTDSLVPSAWAQDPAPAAPTEAAPVAATPAEAGAAVPAAGIPATEVPVEEAEGEYVEEVTPSPWSLGLITSMAALFIGGVSAVLGIWIDRDHRRPVTFAGAMSVLIVAAITVGAAQSYLDAEGAIQQKADLKRMLDMVNEIAVASGDQSLADLVKAEGGPVVVVPPPEVEAAIEAPAEAAVAADVPAGIPADGAPPVEAAPTVPTTP